MLTPLLTVPERLTYLLIDCNDMINGAYHWTQESIDQLEVPCWLVFPEDTTYDNTSPGQDQYEQAYSLAFIGESYAGGDPDFTFEYELQARTIADAAIQYLFEHPQLQCSNVRGLITDQLYLPRLIGVFRMTVNSRSPVTLYTRDAVTGSSGFWGFTIDLTIKQLLVYEEVAF